jgi:hypothetical protein
MPAFAGVGPPTSGVEMKPIEVAMLRREPQRTSSGEKAPTGVEPVCEALQASA